MSAHDSARFSRRAGRGARSGTQFSAAPPCLEARPRYAPSKRVRVPLRSFERHWTPTPTPSSIFVPPGRRPGRTGNKSDVPHPRFPSAAEQGAQESALIPTILVLVSLEGQSHPLIRGTLLRTPSPCQRRFKKGADLTGSKGNSQGKIFHLLAHPCADRPAVGTRNSLATR